NRPEFSTVMELGVAPAPTENGDPATAVRVPSDPIAKEATVACAELATNRKSPLGEIAMELGFEAGVIAKVPIAFRLPLPGSTVKALILLEPWLATYKNGAVGDMATATGLVPTLKMLMGFTGEITLVLTGTESSPLPLLITSCVTSLPAKSAT